MYYFMSYCQFIFIELGNDTKITFRAMRLIFYSIPLRQKKTKFDFPLGQIQAVNCF